MDGPCAGQIGKNVMDLSKVLDKCPSSDPLDFLTE